MIVAHLFWDTAEHLVKDFSVLVNDSNRFRIYLASAASIKTDVRLKESENATWISKLQPKVYQGGLTSAWWWRLRGTKSRVASLVLNILSLILLPEFSLVAIWKIARGPRCWVIHGGQLNFPTMLMFRILGKKVCFIHWGGHVHFWKYARLFSETACRMCTRLYVLMTPERRCFTSFMQESKVEVLPYPSDFMKVVTRNKLPSWQNSGTIPRGIMLGNNVWRRDKYPEILDKLNPSDWDKVVCMLNYGLEGSEAETKKFIVKYEKKFGDAFFPWVGTLPYDEYAKVMASCPFYVCPEEQQTGLGAIYLGAYQGRALILRGDNFAWSSEIGIKVRNLDAIAEFSYQNLCKLFPTEDDVRTSRACLNKFFEEDNTENNWHDHISKSFDGE